MVLLAIAESANPEGRHSYPSIATLSDKTKLHARTVERACQRLKRLGELDWNARWDENGDRTSNMYFLPKFLPAKPPKKAIPPPRRSAAPTPGVQPEPSPTQRREGSGVQPDDPYVQPSLNRTSTAALPPWMSEPNPETASQEARTDEIAAANGGYPQVLRKLAWEKLVECFGLPGHGYGTRAADSPGTQTLLMEWLSRRAAELNIPASDEQIVRAAKAMWNAHAEKSGLVHHA